MFKNLTKKLGLNDKLFKKPKEIPRNEHASIEVGRKGQIIQADILELPDDNGFKYALVAVDLSTRKVDAEPIKKKDPSTVLEAMKTIFNRGTVVKPKRKLEVDGGSEFKGVFKKFIEDNDIIIRVGKPGRSKQQASVESKNHLIGKALFMYMTNLEQVHGEVSREWVNILPKVIKIINQHTKAPKIKKGIDVKCNGDSCNLLSIGQMVRVKLDKPEAFISGKRENGNFRAGDIRWSPTVYKITEVLLKPNQPPLYLLDDKHKTAYHKQELQIVNDKIKDIEPDAEKMGLDPNDTKKQYLIKEILEKRKVAGKVQYKVSWIGYDKGKHSNWLDKSAINKKLIEEFEDKN